MNNRFDLYSDKPFDKTTLPNGARVVTGRMEGVHSATIDISFNVGSRIEPEPIAGVSHYLEHMLFKGTEKRPDPLTISQEIEEVGGMLNASTGYEGTSYWAKVPSNCLEVAFDVLGDMLRGSTFDATEMEKERKVIFEEIRSVQDIPEELVHDELSRLVWGNDAIGRDIAGTEATVANIDRDTMVDFYHRNYTADRLVIAVGGDIHHENVVKLAERYFGDLPSATNPHLSTPAGSTQQSKQVRLITKDTEQAHLCIGFPALGYHHANRYTQSTIDAILGSGMSSRLFQEIREKRGLVYNVGSYFRAYEDVGQGVMYAGTDTERVKETVSAIVGELKKLRDIPVSAEEMQRTKTRRKGRLLMGMEDSRSIAGWISSQESMYGYIETVEEVMEHIDAVTVEDVQALAQEILQENLLSLVLIGPYTRENEYLSLLSMDSAG